MEDGYGGGVGMGNGQGLPGGPETARRFNFALKKFPRADGEPWTGAEIGRATDHVVSNSYVSALANGKLKRPGLDKLSLIADVLGFPFELWRIEPELWDEYLKTHPPRGGIRSASRGQPVPRVPCGEQLAVLVGTLFAGRRNPATGEPYTDEDVIKRSRGRLTAEEVRRMRSGEQVVPPPEIKLIALSDVFGVARSYWYAQTEEPAVCRAYPDSTERGLLEAIVEGCEVLDTGRRRQVLACVDLLAGGELPYPNGPSTAGEMSPRDGARRERRGVVTGEGGGVDGEPRRGPGEEEEE